MEDLTALFLNDESLLRIMTYMCRDGADPIVDTLYTMLNATVQFALNRYGLVLFRGHGVFPYAYMSVEQRQCLYQLAQHVCDKQHSAYARADDPLRFSIEDDHIVFAPTLQLPQHQVFDVLIRALQQSKRGSPMLCNIILQKLGTRMLLHKDSLAYIYEKSKAL